MKNQKLIVFQKNFRRKIAKLSEQLFFEYVAKPMGRRIGPDRVGNASVSQHVITKQDYTKFEHVKA